MKTQRIPHPLSPRNPGELSPKSDFDPTFAQKALAVGFGVLALFGALKVLDSDPARDKAQKEEIEMIDEMRKYGGQFYMGELRVREDGAVRSEPAILNADPALGPEDNKLDHPDNLVLVDPIVISNEDGTWFGVLRSKDAKDELSTKLIWVNAEAIDGDIDRDMIVDFNADENPEPEAFERDEW